MTEIKINATIREAAWLPGNRCIYGTIYGDEGARFGDGDVVTTSRIVENLGDDIYRTKSGTIYKVEFATKPEEGATGFYRVVKGHDAWIEYATVVEATSPRAALLAAGDHSFDGKWVATGDIPEYDHSELFEDRVEQVEAETLEEAKKALAKDYPELERLSVTPRQRDTILTGLRALQMVYDQCQGDLPDDLRDLLTNGGANEVSDDLLEDIDTLCEEINLG